MRLLWTLLAVSAWAAVGVASEEPRGHHEAGERLGALHFPVSCSPQAQATFNRAVALLHHMTYPQARKAFEEVARTDPNCAMAQWGIAMTLFQPSWPTRPGPEELAHGWGAVELGRSLEPATERERMFLNTVEAFFSNPDSTDYWLRIRNWEAALERLHIAFPDDMEAAAFYALAHLAVAPAGEVSLQHAERVAAILLEILEQNPDHPGAMHYMVHANDTPSREHESMEVVQKYEAIAPNNPHALHMPTHIYTRVGDWDAVIRGNLRAAEAALAHPAGEAGELVSDEYPHAIEYLVYAYLQKGSEGQAAEAIEHLRSATPLQPSFKTAFHLASTEARYALERQDWERAAAIRPAQPESLAWERFKWPEAISWFARGLGAAHLGEVETARRAAERLGELSSASEASGEQLFTRNIRVLELELLAWSAHVDEDRVASIRLLKQASEIETSTPKHAVTPGPTLPAQELLGDLLLAQQQPKEALGAYRRSLELYPQRLNSLIGAARAARRSGEKELAASFYRDLIDGAKIAADHPAAVEAQHFLESRSTS